LITKGNKMELQRIGVVGLGYIGLPLIAALASVGYYVIGIDVFRKKIERLQRTYEADIYEPGLTETLQRCRDKIEFTTDNNHLMQKCDTIMITVGTPIRDDVLPDYDQLNDTITTLGVKLRKGQLIILKSTVLPHMTEEVAQKLEENSGLKAGTDFYLAFCPERTIEGMALHELYTLPKIIGGLNEESTKRAASIMGKLQGRIIKVSSPRVAEMCKFIDNLYRAQNIAFANEIGDICEELGIDAYEVASAVNAGYDRTQLYKPGLGADGPCLSKDPLVLKYYARQAGVNTPVLDACISQNKHSTLRIASIASKFINDNRIANPQVALIGLAFKGFPETDDIRDSPAIKIHNALQKELDNLAFKYYDPIVTEFLGAPVCSTLNECTQNSNILIFLTNHRAVMSLAGKDMLANSARPLLIIDCWHNIANPEAIASKSGEVEIFRVGDGRL